MKRIWIKLYLEILDDPKMGRLPDWLWRRAIELFLLAGENGNDGLLQPVMDMAWRLRTSEEDLVKSLRALSQVGVVHETPEGWVVTHFKDRQVSESLERTRKYRERRHGDASHNEQSDGAVAGDSSSSLNSFSEGEGVGEGEEIPIPETVKQAMEHPDIQAFQKVCERIPADKNYAAVIDAIRYLRKEHGAELVDFLKPYWLAWSTRKTKDGKLYSKNSVVWLCEWAMQGEIPSANGSEPKFTPIPDADATRKMLEEKDRLIAQASRRMTK